MGMGKQLEKILKERNMNVNEFANILGVRPQRIYNIIMRDTRKVQSELLEKIANTLGVPKSFFFSDSSIDDLILKEYEEDRFEHFVKENEDTYTTDNSEEIYRYKFKDGTSVDITKSSQRDGMPYRQAIFEYYFSLLNDEGKKELLKRVSELSRLEEYRKKLDPLNDPEP